ncbi:phosphoribosylaminoimidazolesuccinocarboxamide synthase [Acidihalobacter yilgarnensis]|uniref:Phosphoribosylaminoimidazole-succinocarboxamide synthase n=1 Tax=Acidihalobacter yilgarnensis TaxID=2819280 RepID=A0A1D8IK53_9GAMM|nr:phosphoribosylaminoimidazolesuccinocarboxamide synthase [Acidihalobacter yilgarnensis]AOU96853.1 phosphoribosylaminoimidazolesuccinocarboxamide synthase [Acidihalobacter yilgarnensis]
MADTLFQAEISSLPLVHRGKVRDIFTVDDRHLLIVATDRLSAFDVILPDPIPDKGRTLTRISQFWFARLAHLCRNHLSDLQLEDVLPDPAERAPLIGRSMIVRRLEALPVEAIVRGYLIGSGWKDYQRNGAVCGIKLPTGLPLAGQLPEAIFTPSTKAAVGDHDENVDFANLCDTIGAEEAARVRDLSLALYREAATYALEHGIIIADTKFEFGRDPENGELVLIDEVLTPDSSRFWPADAYRPGANPPSFDKQFVRDYLETLDWDKKAPGPSLPADIITRTRAKYAEALLRLTGQSD